LEGRITGSPHGVSTLRPDLGPPVTHRLATRPPLAGPYAFSRIPPPVWNKPRVFLMHDILNTWLFTNFSSGYLFRILYTFSVFMHVYVYAVYMQGVRKLKQKKNELFQRVKLLQSVIGRICPFVSVTPCIFVNNVHTVLYSYVKVDQGKGAISYFLKNVSCVTKACSTYHAYLSSWKLMFCVMLFTEE